MRAEPDEPVPIEGTITRIVAQRRGQERVRLYLNDAPGPILSAELVYRYGLKKGVQVSEKLYQELREADDHLQAAHDALQLVAGRPRTRLEVQRKLHQKGYCEAAILNALSRLSTLGYLDDVAYCRSYLEARLRNKGYGPARLRRELLTKGIEPGLLEEMLRTLLSDEETRSAALTAAQKKLRVMKRVTDAMSRKKKLFDYLRRQGFDYQLALDTASRLSDAAVDEDSLI